MPRLPRVTGKDVIAALVQVGFDVARVKGGHHFLRHRDGRVTVVPVHAAQTFGPGLLARFFAIANSHATGFRRFCNLLRVGIKGNRRAYNRLKLPAHGRSTAAWRLSTRAATWPGRQATVSRGLG